MLAKTQGEFKLLSGAEIEKVLVFRTTDVLCGSESRELREGVRSTLVKILVLLYSRRHEDVKKIAA